MGKTVSPSQGFSLDKPGIARARFYLCTLLNLWSKQRRRARHSQEAFCRQEEGQHRSRRHDYGGHVEHATGSRRQVRSEKCPRDRGAWPGALGLGFRLFLSCHDKSVRVRLHMRPDPNASPSKFIFDLEPPSHDPRPKNLKRGGKPEMTADDSL